MNFERTSSGNDGTHTGSGDQGRRPQKGVDPSDPLDPHGYTAPDRETMGKAPQGHPFGAPSMPSQEHHLQAPSRALEPASGEKAQPPFKRGTKRDAEAPPQTSAERTKRSRKKVAELDIPVQKLRKSRIEVDAQKIGITVQELRKIREEKTAKNKGITVKELRKSRIEKAAQKKE